MSTPKNFATSYVASRILEDRYEKQLVRLASRIKSFGSSSINSYLKARSKEVASVTLANERRVLLTLWQAAYEDGFTDTAPRGVLKVKAVQPPVECWDIKECSEIVNYAEKKYDGEFRHGLSYGKFLACWSLLAYETAARYGDIFTWTEDCVKHGQVTWTVSKTGVPLSRPISNRAELLVEHLCERSPDKRILGWACHRRTAFKMMKKLLQKCGVDGSSKWFRRTAGTVAEMKQQGAGRLMLGHKSVGVFERHYFDTSKASEKLPKLPALQ